MNWKQTKCGREAECVRRGCAEGPLSGKGRAAGWRENWGRGCPGEMADCVCPHRDCVNEPAAEFSEEANGDSE